MLTDSYGRVATDLRVSLTDRCNLRCSYCMPAEGLDWLPAPEVLTGDEVVRLEIMKVDGTKLVRTEKEVDVEPNTKVAKQEEKTKPALAPSLRRPGEDSDSDDPRSAPGAAPLPPNTGGSSPGSNPN